MKWKLNTEELTDEFFGECRILGIVAPVKDYQLCWHLNQLLHFDFRNNTEIEIQLNKKQRVYYFSVFQYNEKNSSLVHYLYNNHFDGEFLLPELRHLDYLWLLKGDSVDDERMNDLMQAIKSIHPVQLVTELKQDSIRNKGHLIF
jgi:hypothetical protein